MAGIVTESNLFRLLTRVMGALEPSTRLQLVLTDPTTQLASITRIMAVHGVPVVSLVTEPEAATGHRMVVLHMGTIAPDPRIRELEQTSVRVLEPASVH